MENPDYIQRKLAERGEKEGDKPKKKDKKELKEE